jgi:hypothetical protein
MTVMENGAAGDSRQDGHTSASQPILDNANLARVRGGLRLFGAFRVSRALSFLLHVREKPDQVPDMIIERHGRVFAADPNRRAIHLRGEGRVR